MSTSPTGAKLFVAFVVLGGAFLLARPFRHDVPRKPQEFAYAADQVVLRETPAPDDVQIIRPDAPTAEIQPTLLVPPPDAAAERRWNEEVARLAPPPMMARTYPSPESSESASTSQLGVGLSGDHHTSQRTHQVRDGDTLEDLAERYLGDRNRWPEIFHANRDRIVQPDLLPLAMKLVIPPKHLLLSTPSQDRASVKSVVQAPLVRLTP